jgi:hypothetical protein
VRPVASDSTLGAEAFDLAKTEQDPVAPCALGRDRPSSWPSVTSCCTDFRVKAASGLLAEATMNGPRYQAGQPLRRRFAQKLDEGERQCPPAACPAKPGQERE